MNASGRISRTAELFAKHVSRVAVPAMLPPMLNGGKSPPDTKGGPDGGNRTANVALNDLPVADASRHRRGYGVAFGAFIPLDDDLCA